MRIFIFLLLISIFTSCDHPKKPYIEELSWRARTIELDNDLGTLTIRLPEEFDTSYVFTDKDDHSCGDFRKYRFQSSKFQTLEESGFFKPQQVDSLKFFTVKHNLRPCDGGINLDTSWLNNVAENHFRHMKDNDRLINPVIRKKEKTNFYGRNFFIIAHENGEFYHIKDITKKLKSAKMMAFTRVNKDYILYLNFDCAASNCDSFIPKMYKALKTVQIKPN